MERIWLGEKQRKITRIDHAGWNEPSWLSQSLTFLGFQRRPAFKNNIFFSNPETLQAVSSQNQLNNYGKTTSYNNNHETNLLIHSYRNKVIMIMKDQTWQFWPARKVSARPWCPADTSSPFPSPFGPRGRMENIPQENIEFQMNSEPWYTMVKWFNRLSRGRPLSRFMLSRKSGSFKLLVLSQYSGIVGNQHQ